jgi:hypothetical protein
MKYTKNKQILTFFALIIISLGTGFIAPSLHAVDAPVVPNQAQLDMPLLNNGHLLDAMLQAVGQGIAGNEFLAFLNQNHNHPLVEALRTAIGGIPAGQVNRWLNWRQADGPIQDRNGNTTHWDAIQTAIGAVVAQMEAPNAEMEDEAAEDGENKDQSQIQLPNEPWSCPGVQMNQGEYDQPEYNQPFRGPRGKASQKDHFEKLYDLILQYWEALNDFKASNMTLADDPNWAENFGFYHLIELIERLLDAVNLYEDKKSDECKRLLHTIYFAIGCIRYDWWTTIGEAPDWETTENLICLLIGSNNTIFGTNAMKDLFVMFSQDCRFSEDWKNIILTWQEVEGEQSFSNRYPWFRILFHAYHIMPDMAHEFYQRYAHLFTNDTLFTIAEFRNIQILRILLQMGMTVDVPNNKGVSLLAYACRQNDPEMVQLLLEYNADVNQINNCEHDTYWGINVLNYAARDAYHRPCEAKTRWLEIIRLLLENGADVNQASQERRSLSYLGTPLHNAARDGNIPLVLLLLEYGANIHTRNLQDNTPYDLAQIRGVNFPQEIWDRLNPNLVIEEVQLEPQPEPQNEVIPVTEVQQINPQEPHQALEEVVVEEIGRAFQTILMTLYMRALQNKSKY